MSVQITIIGLRQVGASIGLALAAIKDQVVRVGNDRELSVARNAEKAGAVEKITLNLHSAVEDADVVILALPVHEIRQVLEMIAEDFKTNTVLIDTSPVKGAVMGWVRELMPRDDCCFVSMTPGLNPKYVGAAGAGEEQPHADLFQNSLMLITTPTGVDQSTVNLALNLTQILGCKPLLADPVEADGLATYGHVLPRLVSAALVNATIDQPGWREARKLSGPAYAQATAPAARGESGASLAQLALLNSTNTTRLIDNVIAELHLLRDAISGQESDLLQERLEHAREGRELWERELIAAAWDSPEKQANQLPTRRESIGRLFGIRSKNNREARK